MLEIKGSVIKGTVEKTRKILGEDEYNKLISLLHDEGRKLLGNPLSTSTWYSFDAYTNFLDVLMSEKLNGNHELLIKFTEKVVEKQFKNIYSAFVKKDSPEFLLERMPALHSVYFRGVQIEPSIIAAGKGKVKYTGFEKHHAVFESCLIGFYQKAAEVYGAKNVKVEFTTRIAESKGYAEVFITWDV